MSYNPGPAALRALADPARLEVLGRTGLPDPPADEGFDRITRLAASVLPRRF